MAADAATEISFAALLRRYRLAAGLTQEQLAERAGLSVEAIGALERGARRAPYPETVALLARALGLSVAERRVLEGTVDRHRGPALGAVGSAAGSPPLPLTSFVGRGWELAEVRGLLDAARLVTLTGTGGVGKTRLALAAAEVAEGYPDGVRFVDLAPLADPGLVPAAVAGVLGVREQAGRPLAETLVAALGRKRALLLLDNCEHLVDACARLAEALLRGCLRLTILATSRTLLAVAGEAAYRVPSLGLPDPGSPAGAETAREAGAVRLFVERAALVRPDFALTDRNAAAVVAICRRLDGLPLAIELAAVRLRALAPEQLLARLDDRFRLLTGGRTAEHRQQTLRATLDWSHDLLDGPGRALFRRLAVFAGGFTLEAAEAVATGDEGDVLDTLTGLVDQSLLQVEEVEGEARYRLLETVRAYAEERLLASGKAAATRERHAAHFLALAEAGRPHLTGPDRAAWMDRLDRERDNFRAALDLSTSLPDGGVSALRLVEALQRFWTERGYLGEGRRRAELALTLPAAATGSARAAALLAAGGAAVWRGDADGPAYLEEALAITREVGDRGAEAQALFRLGQAAYFRGDVIAARPLVAESAALFRELGDPGGSARALHVFGNAALQGGDLAAARAAYAESHRLYRAAGDLAGAVLHSGAMGDLALREGDLPRARALLEESLALQRQQGSRVRLAAGLNHLAGVAWAEGDREGARRLAEESLALSREDGDAGVTAWSLRLLGQLAPPGAGLGRVARLRESLEIYRGKGDWRGIAQGLAALAGVARAAGDAARAARLLAAASGLLREVGVQPLPAERAEFDADLATARAALGDAGFAAAWGEGEALDREGALAEALAVEEPGPDRSAP